MKGIALWVALFCLADLVAAQGTVDEQAIVQIVESFRASTFGDDHNGKIRQLLADDYVHITPDGILTTSWRLMAKASQAPSIKIDKLHIRVFGDLGVASYLWRMDGENRTTSVMQVFQKRQGRWRIIATQLGGPNPSLTGQITATNIIAFRNSKQSETEIHKTWDRFMGAVNLRTPKGERAEDIDTIRSIFAEDAIYIEPNGNASTREERLALGHPNALRLTGEQKIGAVVVPGAYVPDHIDRQLAVFGNVAVWTSRNPANGDQSVRVWLKRPSGWQMVAIHHGMSYRTK
jgi:ketosteroid isomerase-like protein